MQSVITPPRLAIVVPCYNEEAVLMETNNRLTTLLNELISRKKITADSFIVYVNDGSKCSRAPLTSEVSNWPIMPDTRMP